MSSLIYCLLPCIASPRVSNGYVKRDPSSGISLAVQNMDKLGK